MTKHHSRQSKFSWLKLFVILLTIASMVGVCVSGYFAFTHQIPPIAGAVIFIVVLGLFIWFIIILRKPDMSYHTPSFAIVFLSLVGITLICTFAGIEPLSTYKDNLLNSISAYTQDISKTNYTSDNDSTVYKTTPTASESPLSSSTSDGNSINETNWDIHSVEKTAFDLINFERTNAGLSATLWDDELYDLSIAHTEQMANQRELFHSPDNSPISEDAWGGYGYSQYNSDTLAQIIVDSWMSSPLHKAWILHAPINHSVVSIVSNPDGQYASWTFWKSEVGAGPELVQKAYKLWQFETGGKIPWLTWLHDIKGYPNNPEFLKQLGIK